MNKEEIEIQYLREAHKTWSYNIGLRKIIEGYIESIYEKEDFETWDIVKVVYADFSYWLQMLNITGGVEVKKGSVKKAFNYHQLLKNELNINDNLDTYNRFVYFIKGLRVLYKKSIAMFAHSYMLQANNVPEIRKKNNVGYSDYKTLATLTNRHIATIKRMYREGNASVVKAVNDIADKRENLEKELIKEYQGVLNL